MVGFIGTLNRCFETNLGTKNYIFSKPFKLELIKLLFFILYQQMDKASVLGDAIKYLKQLQEKVKALEEEQTRRNTVESVVVVKKSQLFADDDSGNSSSDSSGAVIDEPLPEIEARFCERNVLIRVHCEKRTGVSEKIMSEIEKLHLTVTSSSILTFGSSALDITVIAQVNN